MARLKSLTGVDVNRPESNTDPEDYQRRQEIRASGAPSPSQVIDVSLAKPMPIVVARAYRDPMPLRDLLASSVYSDADRAQVRDELLEALISQHGNVEVFVRGEEQLVSTRVKSFRQVANAIEFVLGVEGFGGHRETLPVLARVMQSVWGAWWGTFEWTDFQSIVSWRDVAVLVLGDQQFRWLAAQYARTAFHRIDAADRRAALDAIEAAEAYAVEPTEVRLEAMQRAHVAAGAYFARDVFHPPSKTAYSAAYAASSNNVANAATSASHYAADAYVNVYQGLADLTRRLISPGLIAG